MKKVLKVLVRGTLAILPVAVVLAYGLLVTSPVGEAARGDRLVVSPDARVELAAILARVAGDASTAWPDVRGGANPGDLFNRQIQHPAARRVRAWMQQGMTTEILVALFLARGDWPAMERLGPGTGLEGASPSLPGVAIFRPDRAGLTPAAVDSLMEESGEFAAAVGFDALWESTRPTLEARARSIEEDPTLKNLTARLTDFFGEPAVRHPVIFPTIYGSWRAPFACTGADGGEITVVDRASGAARITPETSLSWVCVREFARPTVERLSKENTERIARLSGYWDYLKQGIAASTVAGWEDCLNAHLYRAIDLRVRPQEDSVERELRISSALQSGLGMIRVIDATMTGFDRSRGFYRRFVDYYPTLLEEMVGLEARVRAARPRLGLKVTPTGSGLRIDEILKGFSAEGSPLAVGDVIVEADLRPIVAEETLAQIVQSRRIGDILPVEVERGGKRVRLDVALSKGRIEYEFYRPAAAPASE